MNETSIWLRFESNKASNKPSQTETFAFHLSGMEAGQLVLAALQRSQAQSVLKVLGKKARRREHIVREILGTERVYVANLKVLAGVRVHLLTGATGITGYRY